MNWHYRKSIHGPAGLRLNLSGHGIGFSAGFKGYRVGVDSTGRQYRWMSVPGTGLYSKEYLPPNGAHVNVPFWIIGGLVVLFLLAHL